MSEVFELSERWIQRYAELDGYAATMWGMRHLEDRMPDYSPEGFAARADHRREGMEQMASATSESDHDRLAAAVMRDILGAEQSLDDADEWLRPLYVFGSPVQHLRECFDLMTLDSDEDWERAATRMERLPEAARNLIATLEEGIRRGIMAAPRQAIACAEMADHWAGNGPDGSYFARLVEPYGGEDALRERLEDLPDTVELLNRQIRSEYLIGYSPGAMQNDGKYHRVRVEELGGVARFLLPVEQLPEPGHVGVAFGLRDGARGGD